MDPFNLFWKTVAGLEKVMHYPLNADWSAVRQEGTMIVGGTTFSFLASPDRKAVRVSNHEDLVSVDVDKAVDKIMIADAMEFVLGSLA